MREVDGEKMRQLEKVCREIGSVIGAAIEDESGGKHGFALFVFSFAGPELTYVSNANRGDILNMLEEFTRRQRSGEADQLWAERS